MTGSPFGLAAGHGQLFVALDTPTGSSLAVVADTGGPLRTLRTLSTGAAGLGGAAITHDGRYLLVADTDGVLIVDTAALAAGSGAAIVGRLQAPGEAGTVDVAVSPDDRLVAASKEQAASITLFDLKAALSGGVAHAVPLSRIAVDPGPVGLAFSPDGRWLLSTSESSGPPTGAQAPGSLSLIDVAAASDGRARRPAFVVPAGCSPVRVAVTADGRTAWVTARGSNALAGFDLPAGTRPAAPRLRSWVRVGTAPVGLALTPDGTTAIVADSNRFIAPTQASTATVVDLPASRTQHPSIRATIAVGGFPREVIADPNNRQVLIGDYGTNQLSMVSLS